MSERNLSSGSNQWLSQPLCRDYALAIRKSIAFEVREAEQVSDQTLHWAFGVLADGNYEVLGVSTAASDWEWKRVPTDLCARGIETIRFLSTFGTKAPPSMPRHQVRRLVRAEAVMVQLHRRAMRAINEHGPFPSVEHASRFLLALLERAELCMTACGTSVDRVWDTLVGAGQLHRHGKRFMPSAAA